MSTLHGRPILFMSRVAWHLVYSLLSFLCQDSSAAEECFGNSYQIALFGVKSCNFVHSYCDTVLYLYNFRFV
jgi:hypothetical protein